MQNCYIEYIYGWHKPMATTNNFSGYYKTISNKELLNILDNPGDYQALAIEAAKKELTARQLSDADIEEARLQLITSQAEKDKQAEKIKAVKNKINTTGQSILDTIDPVQSGLPSTEKTIRIIVILFGGLFLYHSVINYKTTWFYIKEMQRFPVDSLAFLAPLLLLFIATIMFWMRKPMGWKLLVIFLTFSCCNVLSELLSSANQAQPGFAVLDNLLSRPSPTTDVIQLLFLIAILYVLCRKNIREVFSISTQNVAATIIITAMATFISMFTILSA